jgi:hypothetical protein
LGSCCSIFRFLCSVLRIIVCILSFFVWPLYHLCIIVSYFSFGHCIIFVSLYHLFPNTCRGTVINKSIIKTWINKSIVKTWINKSIVKTWINKSIVKTWIRKEMWIRQIEHNRGYLWHKYSITINLNLWRRQRWLQLHCIIFVSLYHIFRLAIVSSLYHCIIFFVWPLYHLCIIVSSFSFGHCIIFVSLYHLFPLSWILANKILLLLLNAACLATNRQISIIWSLTLPGIIPIINGTWEQHINHWGDSGIVWRY